MSRDTNLRVFPKEIWKGTYKKIFYKDPYVIPKEKTGLGRDISPITETLAKLK